MFCPQCGKNQASDDVRFCTKCGLPLENAAKLLTEGIGSLSPRSNKPQGLSPRAKGILQGIAIVPTAFGIWLVFDIIYENVFGAGMLGGLYAMFTLLLLVAVSRILYAVFVEEGHRKNELISPSTGPPEIGRQVNTTTLPAVQEIKFMHSDQQRRETADMLQPRSVVENTTRKLEIKE